MTSGQSTAEPGALSDVERARMRHALGLDIAKTPYRNWYGTAPGGADDAIWRGLAERGFAQGPQPNGSLNGYRVSMAGVIALGIDNAPVFTAKARSDG